MDTLLNFSTDKRPASLPSLLDVSAGGRGDRSMKMDWMLVLMKGLSAITILGMVIAWELERRLRNVFEHRESRVRV